MLISFLQYSVSYLHSTKNTLKNTKTYAANLDKKAIRVFCCSNSARGGHLVLWVGSISTRDGHTLFKTWWWSITVNNFTFYLYDFECKSHLNIIIIITTQIFLLIYRRQSSIILVNVCNIFVAVSLAVKLSSLCRTLQLGRWLCAAKSVIIIDK